MALQPRVDAQWENGWQEPRVLRRRLRNTLPMFAHPREFILDQFDALLFARDLHRHGCLPRRRVFRDVYTMDRVFARIEKTIVSTLGEGAVDRWCGNCQLPLLNEIEAFMQRRMGGGPQVGVLLFYLFGRERKTRAGVTLADLYHEDAEVARVVVDRYQHTLPPTAPDRLHSGWCQLQEWEDAMQQVLEAAGISDSDAGTDGTGVGTHTDSTAAPGSGGAESLASGEPARRERRG